MKSTQFFFVELPCLTIKLQESTIRCAGSCPFYDIVNTLLFVMKLDSLTSSTREGVVAVFRTRKNSPREESCCYFRKRQQRLLVLNWSMSLILFRGVLNAK